MPFARLVRASRDLSLGMLIAAQLGACVAKPPPDFARRDDRYQACGARSRRVDGSRSVAFSGTVHQVIDGTPVDGDVDFVLIDGRGQPVKARFGSLYTIPPPSAARSATYENIRGTRRGDCVAVSGTRMADGRIWIETFANHDRHPSERQ